MKAALITEDQIKKVLDAIENSQPMFDSTKTRNRHNKARAILKSLEVQDLHEQTDLTDDRCRIKEQA